jgi:hypothetical protein
MTAPIPAPSDEELARDERWLLLTRMVANQHFGKAAQLRELLLYLGKRAILFPTEDVSEQEIGSRVLGRRPDYNPQADNIVRVQIRRLRQKVDEYFLTDGRDEPLVISIPKGSHVLRFEPRVLQVPVESPAAPPAVTESPWVRWMLTITALGAISFFAGRLSVDRGEAVDARRIHPVWSQLFSKDQPTSIVIADSSLVIVQNVLQKSLTLNEYIAGSYRGLIEQVPDAGVRDVLKMISHRQYTSVADATLSSELRSIGGRLGARVMVRYARDMHIRDFNSGNFILVGSSHGVPWVELFESNLNFQFQRIGDEQRFGFRNRHPKNGEAGFYTSSKLSSGPQESFATVSMVPNLTGNGTVLMLNGITMEATEAAGEFALNNDLPAVLSSEKLPHFEILLKVASLAGAPHKVDVVAWRRIGDGSNDPSKQL